MADIKLTDRYNRILNYLRVSITDRCNLKCIYCKPGASITKLPHKEILTYEEILRLINIGVNLGISKVRITGGEPLVRKGVFDFLGELAGIDGLSDISLTTNGVSLKANLEKIKAAGIKRINVSLDTLNRLKFKKITGHDHFRQVWEALKLAHQQGLHPIKINVVALRGVNDDEIIDLARLTFEYPFHIRFIEFMPIGSSRMDNDNQLLSDEIKNHISVLGRLTPVNNGTNDGPAERYQFEDAKGEIGFIRPLSHHICHRCNRLRLTASGQLRPCLLSDHQEDLKTPMRNGCSDKELAEIFLKVVQFKPHRHNLSTDHSKRVKNQMSGIGG
ncbi:GTP 3',8-cyclase MoaA [Thermodesulfobacteriota bacterium]